MNAKAIHTVVRATPRCMRIAYVRSLLQTTRRKSPKTRPLTAVYPTNQLDLFTNTNTLASSTCSCCTSAHDQPCRDTIEAVVLPNRSHSLCAYAIIGAFLYAFGLRTFGKVKQQPKTDRQINDDREVVVDYCGTFAGEFAVFCSAIKTCAEVSLIIFVFLCHHKRQCISRYW